PYGMTFPEVASIFTNVKNNNNIVWKNVTIVDNFSGPLALAPYIPSGYISVRNVESDAAYMKFRFVIPREEYDNPFLNYGKIYITMPEKMFERWKEGGFSGEGVEIIGKNQINVTKQDAFIDKMK